MFHGRLRTTIETPEWRRTLFVALALGAAVYAGQAPLRELELAVGVVAFGFILVLPTYVQGVLLLLALQAPVGFVYTMWEIGSLSIHWFDLLMLSLSARAGLVWWLDRTGERRRLGRWAAFVIVLVVWTGGAQVLGHLVKGPLAPESWTGWARAMSYFFLVPVFASLTGDRHRLGNLLSLAMWLAVVQGAMGLGLRFVGPELGISREVVSWLGDPKGARAYGGDTYQVAGFLGSSGALGLTAAVFGCLWLAKWFNDRESKGNQPLTVASLLVLGLAVVFSLSRRSVLGIVVGVLLVFLLARRRLSWRGVGFWGLVSVMMVLVEPAVVSRFGPEVSPERWGLAPEETSFGQRVEFWELGLPLILGNPLIGLGWGVYGGVIGRPGQFSHSLYMETALAFGIPGLLLVLGGLWLVVRDGWFLMRRGQGLSWLGLGMIGGVGAAATAGFFEQNLIMDTGRLFWVAVGLQACAVNIARQRQSGEHALAVPGGRNVSRT